MRALRSTCSTTQFSKAYLGRLVAEDGIDILEEGGSNDPVGISSACANVETGVQIKDTSDADIGIVRNATMVHILRVDWPGFSSERHGYRDRG